MSHLYLLDTNILSELIKHPQGLIFYKIKQVGEEKGFNILLKNAIALH